VVYGKTETVLYVDGKNIQAERPTEISGGTPFVVGNVGGGHTTPLYSGGAQDVLSSTAQRHTGEFRPKERLGAGEAPVRSGRVLLYDGTHVEGMMVLDLSGNGHHGRVQRLSFTNS
jgi:hypothetical protein